MCLNHYLQMLQTAVKDSLKLGNSKPWQACEDSIAVVQEHYDEEMNRGHNGNMR